MTAVTWVFGYGSLVSPASLGATLGRPVVPGEGWSPAELHGYGRRWNYGVGHAVGVWTDEHGDEVVGTVVALGLVVAAHEHCNGVVVRVAADELARLDRRERHYDRVDVTDAIALPDGGRIDGAVVTYVPRDEAVERYRRARDAGRAAIEQRYWDLVDSAFAALGRDHVARYRRTTPDPDVPVRAVQRRQRHDAEADLGSDLDGSRRPRRSRGA